MRLKKEQRKAVIKWVAEGLKADEIKVKAAAFKPPFEPSRQQIAYYRKTTKADLKFIRENDKNKALKEGYALSTVRVEKLSILAGRMYKDLEGGYLWLEQKKGVGSGDIAEIFDYLEFNAAEVAQFRGVLDDIAKEMGDRKSNVDLTSQGEKLESTQAIFYIPDNGRNDRD